MITKIKRKDVKKLSEDEIGDSEIYYALDLAADKLRVIWVALGWTHMTDDFFKADETLNHLLNSCVAQLVEDPKRKDANCATAGASVALYENEFGTLSIEIDFKIAM